MDLVGKNSRILALSLQMSPKFRDQITNSFIEAIELAAPLYDIGKAMSYHNIILDGETEVPPNSNGKEIKKHEIFGTELLEDIYKLNEK